METKHLTENTFRVVFFFMKILNNFDQFSVTDAVLSMNRILTHADETAAVLHYNQVRYKPYPIISNRNHRISWDCACLEIPFVAAKIVIALHILSICNFCSTMFWSDSMEKHQ